MARSSVRALALLTLAVACHKPAPPPAGAPAPVTRTPSPTPATAVAAAPARRDTAPPPLPKGSDVTPVYSAADELTHIRVADGYHLELVAAEPLVQDPVAIDFDADGRMYVVEMRAFMPNLEAKGEDRPIGRVVVLEDTDGDGKMDRKTVFLDSLMLPRTVKVMEHGVLVGAPPNLFFARDTNGDLKADIKQTVRTDYGTLQSNPEHNANGLLWGIDNWLHNANYEGEFHLERDGSLAFRPTPSLGQWGVSADDYGRLFRNSNEDPLRGGVIPSHYAGRASNVPNVRGVYDQLSPNTSVWPNHKTPAVNRGYREGILRADSSLAMYTSAGSPTVYTGDRLPAELRGNVFVTEPAGNLVARWLVRDLPNGMLTGHPAYDHREFITSDDQRFRPVNVATAPDGTLYIVDMYRGIIQHRAYITDYLEQKIKERGMEQPVGLGRIWRVVHDGTTRGPTPHLSTASPAQLVAALSHPNGWWRLKAQQLLVERGDRSAAPALRDLLRSSPNEIARLHALWTLDGIGEADAASVDRALADASPWVRAAAVRVSESRLAKGDAAALAAVLKLASDTSAPVRRQLAASLGELPVAQRDSALAIVATRHGDDAVVADLVASALKGREMAFLDRLLASAVPNDTPAVQVLAAAVMRGRDPAAVQRLLARAGDAKRARWQQLALLAGADLRSGGFGRGGFGGGPGGGGGKFLPGPTKGPPRCANGGGRPIELASRPAALLALATTRDSVVRAHASAIVEGVSWPGKSTGKTTAERPLTPAERARFAAGQQAYASTCAGCHQAGGTGLANVAKPLVGSKWVLGQPIQLIRIVLQGKEGDMLMPPIGRSLSDDQIASILTYVRRSWGNNAAPIGPSEVAEVRANTASRTKAWTEAELAKVHR